MVVGTPRPSRYNQERMTELKKKLMKQGMKLMTDPRLMKLMSDERVMKAMMGMMAVPGKVQTFTQEQIDKIAKSMNLATEEEVKELRRTIRRLEDDMRRMNKKP